MLEADGAARGRCSSLAPRRTTQVRDPLAHVKMYFFDEEHCTRCALFDIISGREGSGPYILFFLSDAAAARNY